MPHPTDDAWNWRMYLSDLVTIADEFTRESSEPDPATQPERHAHWREHGWYWQDHGIAEIPADRVCCVELVPSPAHPELPNHFMLVDDVAGQRFIFFRTRVPLINLSDGHEIARLTGTVIGWQKTIGRGGSRRNVQSLTCFLDSGSSFTCSDRAAVRARLMLIAREMIVEHLDGEQLS